MALSEGEGNFQLAINGLCLRFAQEGAGGALHQAIKLAAAAARKAEELRFLDPERSEKVQATPQHHASPTPRLIDSTPPTES